MSLVRLERVGAERERQLDPAGAPGAASVGVVAADPAFDQVEVATLVALGRREVEGEARRPSRGSRRARSGAAPGASRHSSTSTKLDSEPVVRHPVAERTARLSPEQATDSLPRVLDVVLRGGDVVDGTGSPRQRADVGVRDGRIAAIGTRRRAGGATPSTPTAWWSRPASSTSTRTTTRRCCGTRCARRRRCTASPPSSAATAGSRSRRSATRPTSTTSCG